MEPNLTEKEFSQHVGSEFALNINEQNIRLKLAEVKGYLAQGNEQTGMERFSVFFEGPGDILLPQATYPIRHEQMGEFELFLVPISRDETGFRYEAVFNYFK